MFACGTSNTLTQSSHALRYVLKNRTTNEPLLVVIFTLLPKEESKEDSDENDEFVDANEDDELD